MFLIWLYDKITSTKIDDVICAEIPVPTSIRICMKLRRKMKNRHQRTSEQDREWLKCEQSDVQPGLRMYDCEHIDRSRQLQICCVLNKMNAIWMWLKDINEEQEIKAVTTQFMPTFRVKGQIYHKAGSLHSLSNGRQKFNNATIQLNSNHLFRPLVSIENVWLKSPASNIEAFPDGLMILGLCAL
ncbi:unnamed protein product [Onchocerca flexuosa]|uniref:Helitron_like_N domain-containing protein n=1 Tax=Onchocerca flexuosa TaxID=387005 RepID=A0A183H7R2_9BILA|nr:unnamed protein product [Onchocerca flexuosa]